MHSRTQRTHKDSAQEVNRRRKASRNNKVSRATNSTPKIIRRCNPETFQRTFGLPFRKTSTRDGKVANCTSAIAATAIICQQAMVILQRSITSIRMERQCNLKAVQSLKTINQLGDLINRKGTFVPFFVSQNDRLNDSMSTCTTKRRCRVTQA